jgi:Kef-type K+ transport system membrane component KefB
VKGAAIRLALVLGVLGLVSLLTLKRNELGTPVTLAAGALLLCGIFAGKVAKGFGLPRLTGYLLIGIVVGPYAMRFIPKQGVAGLELVKGLAVSLIALAAGTELRLGLIRRVGKSVLRTGVFVCGTIFAITFGTTLLGRPLLPFMASMTWPQTLAVAAMISAVIVSFSPTVTIAIVQETRARGPFTEYLMALVIIGDLLVLIAFALSAGLTRASFGGGFGLVSLAGGIGWELFGSLVVGGALGVGMLAYLRRFGKEVALFITAACLATAELGMRVHLSPLLLSLAAGAVVANLDERQAEKVHHAIERAGLPVFALFFAAAGAGLHLDVLGTVGAAAALFVALRAWAIHWSCRRFAPAQPELLRKNLWMGLISQAGVTFGLASLVGRSFPGFGTSIEALIIAIVTVHELIGPVLIRRALNIAGEAQPEGEAA